MQVLSIQPTPNPNAYKFIVDKQLLDAGTRHYDTAQDAQGDALAAALFAVPGVETLYFAENFVTVSTGADADWRALHEQVKGVLDTHFVDTEDAAQTAQPTAGAGPDTDDPDLLRQINEILDDRVRPALAGDGGGLEILSLENKALTIRYQGACGSCPSAIAGTLRAIENLLQMEVDQELAVLPA
ncbi:MAG: NifU family protein [Planctomycetota bacterium]|jgi:Fe-S cluster biogenesis protein NfuA